MSGINWGALGIVALVSLAVGVIVVVLVSLAMVGLSARGGAPEGELVSADDTPLIGKNTSAMSPAVGTTVAAICLLAAAAVVLYGLYIIRFYPSCGGTAPDQRGAVAEPHSVGAAGLDLPARELLGVQ